MQCPTCKRDYTRIGSHWCQSSCNYPPFTDRQREIITGFLMSDAWIDKSGNNPRIQSAMITKGFLEWVDKEMGIFGNGVRFKASAEKSAKQCRDRGFSANAKAENYHDVYDWRSVTHPELQEFAAWYGSGKKVWPESIELTPLSLKVFYCGDGTFENKQSRNRISFAMSNERKNKGKVEKLFDSVGLSGKWSEYEHRYNYYLNVKQTERAFDIMGDPLPGFEYKWP